MLNVVYPMTCPMKWMSSVSSVLNAVFCLLSMVPKSCNANSSFSWENRSVNCGIRFFTEGGMGIKPRYSLKVPFFILMNNISWNMLVSG